MSSMVAKSNSSQILRRITGFYFYSEVKKQIIPESELKDWLLLGAM